MKTSLLSFAASAVLLLGHAPASAQSLPRCATPPLSALTPEQRGYLDQVEKQTQEYVRQVKAEQAAQALRGDGQQRANPYSFVIPVVVHVVYNPGIPAQNITDQVIADQIKVLNDDFARLNADAGSTEADHLAVAAGSRISFKLASYDPTGACTTGIERIPTSHGTFGNALDMKIFSPDAYNPGGTLYGANAWDARQYLNIWVCAINFAKGFSYYPSERVPRADDGVVVDYRSFGSGTQDPVDKGRICTHEVGHYLNLRHVFGEEGFAPVGQYCADDLVADTNPVEGVDYYLPGSTTPDYRQVAFIDCIKTRRSNCAGGNTLDMYEDYMSYANGGCQNMFTAGQVNRMTALFITGGPRNSLITNSGAFFPRPSIATAVRPSYCGATSLKIDLNSLKVCPGNLAVVSYTFAFDVVDANTSFDANGSQSDYTFPVTPGTDPYAIIDMKGGDYTKYLVVTANFVGGQSSSGTRQPLQMNSTRPGSTLPGTIAFFQEKDNSCYYSLSVPVLPGADRYSATVSVNGAAGVGYNVDIPAGYSVYPGKVDILTGIKGNTTPMPTTVTLYAYNRCGSTTLGPYNLVIPAAPAGCYGYVTNRAATPPPAPAQVSVSLYPNPATQEVTLTSAREAGFTSGVIRTPMGRVMKTFPIGTDKSTIDLSGFMPGLYLIELQGSKGLERHQLSIGTL